MEKEQLESLRREFNERIDKILANEKPEIVPGKWYRVLRNGNSYTTLNEWGFNYKGGTYNTVPQNGTIVRCVKNRTHNHPVNAVVYEFETVDGKTYFIGDKGVCPATKSEIESALIPYLKENYPKGSRFISVTTDKEYTSCGEFTYESDRDVASNNSIGDIYLSGKFAKKVESPKYDCKGLEVHADERGAELTIDGELRVFLYKQLTFIKRFIQSGGSVNDLNKIIEGK